MTRFIVSYNSSLWHGLRYLVGWVHNHEVFKPQLPFTETNNKHRQQRVRSGRIILFWRQRPKANILSVFIPTADYSSSLPFCILHLEDRFSRNLPPPWRILALLSGQCNIWQLSRHARLFQPLSLAAGAAGLKNFMMTRLEISNHQRPIQD